MLRSQEFKGLPQATRPWLAWLSLLAVALILFLPHDTALAADYPADSRIDWRDWDSKLFERSAASERPIFFYFHGQWCTWCRDFQEESLENPSVIDTLHRHYIPVLVDVDERADLFRRYGGRGLPFVVIVNHQDEILTRFTGHLRARSHGGPPGTALCSLRHRPRDGPGRCGGIDDLDAFLAMLDAVYDKAPSSSAAAAPTLAP